VGNLIPTLTFHRRSKVISKLFDYINLFLHNSWIPSECDIGKGVTFSYSGIGVVIHKKSKIGDYCIIGSGVTIGTRGNEKVPVIEHHVNIGSGAKILGDILIGHHSIIGPNAVIIHDVPPFSIVVGVPGRVIKTIDDKNNRDYVLYFRTDE